MVEAREYGCESVTNQKGVKLEQRISQKNHRRAIQRSRKLSCL
jgi:hypothetical protein